MSRRQSTILLAAAVWTFYVWISRIVILAGQDTSTAFKLVHFFLAVVSIGFGVAIAWIALKSRKNHTP